MLRLLIPLALATLVAACSDPTTSAGVARGGDGLLRLSFQADPRQLNPNLGPDEAALIIGQNLFSRLVSLGVDGSIIPELAERWDESSDGLTYTFHLREGVTWHDGRSLTADDVRLTLLRVVEESANRDVASHIADVIVPDSRSVEVRLKEPWAAFLPSLAWFGTSILPAHIYGAAPWKDHPANMRPIGTGPFKLKAWEPGVRLVLEKHEGYFGPGPYVDEIEYVFARSADESADLLMSGRADLLVGRPPSSRVKELSRARHLRVSAAPGEGRTYLAFNLRRPPFDDLRVRQGVNMAIDRRALVYGPLAGIGAPAFGFYTPTVGWAYNGAAQAPRFDLAAARRALAGAQPGRALTLLCFELGSVPALADEIVRQLAAAGLRVRSDCRPAADYLSRLLTARDFDLALMTGAQGPDPDNLAQRFASTGASQVMGYSNSEVDDLLARAARTSDVSERAAAYHRVQAILAQDLPVAPLVETIRVTVARAGLRGLPQEDARGLVPEFMYNLIRLPSPR